MKHAITISTEDAFEKALVVFRGLEKNLPTIAKLGYEGIELAIWRGDVVDVGYLKGLLSEHGLELPVVSTGQVFTKENAWFTHPDKEVRDRAVTVMMGIVEFAAEFGAAVNISRVRGYVHEGDSEELALERLTECLEPLATRGKELGCTLVLEQMNMFETNYFHNVPAIGDYLRSRQLQNVMIHADTFHMNIEDVDVQANLRNYADLLGYVHLSDSNRRYPGAGHIDFPAILKTLTEIGYEGWLGIEVFADPDPDTAARESIEYLRRLGY